MELTKKGNPISKVSTQRNGKYSIRLDVSTSNLENVYLIYIFKEGAIPKTISVNTYIPKEEYSELPYTYQLDVNLIATSITGANLNFHSAKIRWDSKEHGFAIDKEYQRSIESEEKKIEADPNKYMSEIIAKIKLEKENAKKNAERLAKAKIDEESKALLELKKKDEGAKRFKNNMVAINKEVKEIKTNDNTLPSPEVLVKEKIIPQPIKKLTPIKIIDETEFDGFIQYSMNIEKNKQKNLKAKMDKKKSANFSVKYETSNILTSLLDVIDEYDKKEKK